MVRMYFAYFEKRNEIRGTKSEEFNLKSNHITEFNYFWRPSLDEIASTNDRVLYTITTFSLRKTIVFFKKNSSH